VLQTKSGQQFLLPEGNLQNLSDTGQVVVLRGFITKYPVDIILESGNRKEVYATSFLKRTKGGIIVSVVTALTFVVLTVLFIVQKRVEVGALFCFLFFLCFVIYSLFEP
jgi:hypothetical protein